MNKQLTKKMLCLSVDDRGAEPSIEFEIGPYYAYRHRWVGATEDLNIFDKDILLRDKNFKDELAFSMIAHLIHNYGSPIIKGKPGCLMIYPHTYDNKTVIAIGIQVRFDTPQRKFCTALPLHAMNRNHLWDDMSFKLTLAETVLKYLPISEALCHVEDTELKYDRRPQ